MHACMRMRGCAGTCAFVVCFIYHCLLVRYHHHTAEEQSHAGEVFRKVHTTFSLARTHAFPNTHGHACMGGSTVRMSCVGMSCEVCVGMSCEA
jgi:hypothetical protein